MQPENLAAVRLGIASHNLFTLAYGLVLATKNNALDRVQFEMLEGMANHQRRALFELTGNMLLYAPACKQEDFTNAIGYLVRRLDENTGPDNFLRHAFNIEVGSDDWNELEAQFVAAFEAKDVVSSAPRRTQNRSVWSAPGSAGGSSSLSGQTPGKAGRYRRFRNEPDTDWSLPQNGAWAQSIVDTWQPRHTSQAAEIPLVIAGKELTDDRPTRDSLDPSRPNTVVAKYRQATEDDINRAVEVAKADPDGWRRRPINERVATLHQAATEFAAARGELMGAMLAEGGKTLAESDPEVSEAIDFCRFYSNSAHFFDDLFRRTDNPVRRSIDDGHDCPSYFSGRGVVVIVSPWNFPLAIPTGGVAAALSAGNNVILKPASDTVLIAYHLCQCFWRAGVPKTALQFAPCSGGTVGAKLVSHPGVDAIVLTGGTETAAEMLSKKPTMHLIAETGGKNATIVTALADRDQAIKNVLHSAFSHSGQKCSATSLLILESEIYHDPKFRAAFCDAVESLRVGSAWELQTKVGPLIRPPSGVLETSLKELEPGEEWAVMPRLHVDDNPNLVSPGVKWGVQPRSFTHCTELFGPLLGVMEARDLDAAIALVNATGYGLTSGLESLDDREQELWASRIRAGNLYINRSTTGAIVLRQPFGGMGKSSVGPGIKAGGPNYVVPLMRFADRAEGQTRRKREGEDVVAADSIPAILTASKSSESDTRWVADLNTLRHVLEDGAAGGQPNADTEICRVLSAIDSYETWARDEFRTIHDHFRLLGEDNFRRYLPVEPLRIRVDEQDSLSDIFCRALAARAAGCRAIVSTPPSLDGQAADAAELLDRLTDSWAGAIEFIEEDDATLAAVIRTATDGRVRYAAPERVPESIRAAAAELLQYVADTPVSTAGRIELLWYFREQSVSHVYHRYGNLGSRANETRDEPG
jgi:RHH-type proline utilization regulon transcriptional repressor/proline dehydrogenase/delta 1-pyrroline-5-carboxylate dehydrogenase